MKINITIDDAMNVTVSRPCDACGVDVPTNEHLGYGSDYLCSDCFGDPEYYRKKEKTPDEMYIHDWLIFLDEDNPLDCGPIAIHKDVVGRHFASADCSTPDPEEDITRFGPGSFDLSTNHIDTLFFDVTHVHLLSEEGLIDSSKAHTVFKTKGGAK